MLYIANQGNVRTIPSNTRNIRKGEACPVMASAPAWARDYDAFSRFWRRPPNIPITLLCSGIAPFGVSLSTRPGRIWAIAALQPREKSPLWRPARSPDRCRALHGPDQAEIGGFGPELTQEDINPPIPFCEKTAPVPATLRADSESSATGLRPTDSIRLRFYFAYCLVFKIIE